MKQLAAVFVIIAGLTPPLLLLYLSVVASWQYPALLAQGFSAVHWQYFLRSGSGLLSGAGLSAGLALAVGSVATLAGFFSSRYIAWRLSRRWWLPVYFPYVIAPVILAVLLNRWFIAAGLSGHVTGVFVAQLLVAFPFCTLFFAAFWNERMRRMEGLAATLGATPAQIFSRVLWPVARPQLALCFFQSFLISWFEYGLTQLIGVGKVATLPVRVFQYVNEANPHLAALAGLLLLLPPMLLLWFNQRYVWKRMLP